MLHAIFDFTVLIAVFFYIGLHGWSLCRVVGVQKYVVSASYTIGLGYIALIFLLSSYLNWHWQTISYVYIGTTLLTMLLGAFWQLIHFKAMPQWRLSAHAVFAYMALIIAYSIYYAWAGIYDLVPTDVLRHLERIQESFRHLTLSNVPRSFYIDSINDRYIYYIYAVLWYFIGGDVLIFLHRISWLSAIVFISSLYWFVYHAGREHTRHIVLLSVLTCTIFIMHQGFANLPYLRHYALSAAIWMMPIFFLGVLLIRDYFQYKTNLGQIFLVIACLLVCSLYHLQEALFIIVMAIALLLYYFFISILDNRIYRSCQSRFLSFSLFSKLLFGIFIFITIYYLSIQSIAKTPVDDFKVIDLADFLGFGDHLYVLNPFYQFNQVATHFGFLIYLLGVLFFPLFLRIPILAAGLLVPFLTVFNPVFIDVFIRFRDVHVVYRFLFITPFAFAGAYFITRAYERIRQDTIIVKITRWLLIGVLLLSLMPLNLIRNELRYSRIADLGPVPQNQSLRHIDDAISFLNTLPNSHYIQTDQVTGYMLTATTKHISPRYKFYPSRDNFVGKATISKQDFRYYRGWLLVVNLRDGGNSAAGSLSTHWPTDILKTSKFYSKSLLDYIEQSPKHLKLLWQKDNFRIYKIE